MRRILMVALALVMMASFTACASTESTAPAPTEAPEAAEPAAEASEATDGKQVVQIGLLAPISGAVASQGEMMEAGLRTCIQYFEENVGFKNQTNVEIEVVVADTESSVDTGVAAFERLVNVDNVDLVIGSYQSAVCSPCAALANKYKVPYVICNAVSDKILAEDANYVFRPCLGDAAEMNNHLEFMQGLSALDEIKTMAYVSTADDYGNGALSIYEWVASEIGAEMVVVEQVQAGVADMSGVVQKIKQADPDICVSALQLNEALLFQRQMREYQCNVPVFAKGAGYNDSTFIASSNGTAEYVTTSTGWLKDSLQFLSEDAAVWAQKIADNNNGLFPNEVGANAWLCTGVALDAIDRVEGEVTRESIAAALDVTDLDQDHWANIFFRHPRISFSDREVNGTMIYNQNWDAKVQFGQLQNDEWVLVYPFSLVGTTTEDTNPIIWPPQY